MVMCACACLIEGRVVHCQTFCCAGADTERSTQAGFGDGQLHWLLACILDCGYKQAVCCIIFILIIVYDFKTFSLLLCTLACEYT